VNYEGKVLIDGVAVNPKVHRIGLIPQNYGLIKWKNRRRKHISFSKN